MDDQDKETPREELGFRKSGFPNRPLKYPLKAGRRSVSSLPDSLPVGKRRIHLRIDPPDLDRVYRADIAAELVNNGKAFYVGG
jgi:hypothetical protein